MKRDKLLKHLQKRVTGSDIEYLREDSYHYLVSKNKIGKYTIRASIAADGSFVAKLVAHNGAIVEVHQFQVFELRPN